MTPPVSNFVVGVHDPQPVADSRRHGGEPLPDNHSPRFAPVPGPTIKTAVQAMSVAVPNVLPARRRRPPCRGERPRRRSRPG